MEIFNQLNIAVKPILYTIYLELKLQKLKFIIISSISIILFILTGLIPYLSISTHPGLPPNQAEYFFSGIMFYLFMVIISVGIFFSGLICTEYQKKTGLTVFPLINKLKLIIGKFIANYIVVIAISIIYYSFMGIFSYYFYGGPTLYTIFISFSFLILYLLALASITTFVSSLMPSPLPVFAIITGYLLLGGYVIDPLLRSLGANLEPIYSISYLYYIVQYTIYPNFAAIERFDEYSKIWWFPTAESATIMLIIYAIVFFSLAYLIFKSKQL